MWRKQQRGGVRHAVLDVRTTVLRDTTIPVDSMTQVLSHARKITCAGVRRMRGFLCCVYIKRGKRTSSSDTFTSLTFKNTAGQWAFSPNASTRTFEARPSCPDP